ncbi:hypothetical protein BpHYR1_017051 [Brachionus plicatilis]|uniref:Uncharacterized protein n=1 Tax=Brachionus plicatilis TaxID=10195 RepID=A0A3M7T1X6_BRAPC|nr:hypothetical protein BpHYR1_017051 [Brachionus plicatilis]
MLKKFSQFKVESIIDNRLPTLEKPYYQISTVLFAQLIKILYASLVTSGSLSAQNQYCSDDNEDENLDDKSNLKYLTQPSASAQASNSESDTPVKKKKKKESLDRPKSNIRINELLEQMEKGQKIGETKPDFDIKIETAKKSSLKRRRSSNQLKISDNVTVLDENAITDPSDAPVSNVSEVAVQAIVDDQSSHSQQDDEIKELLKTKDKANDQHFKNCGQKDKTDLFLKKLLNSNTSGDIVNFLPSDTHAIKAATPVFELLMSPLFNTILTNSNSNSSSSTASTNSANSTSGQHITKTSFNNSISTQQKSNSPTNFKKAKLDHKTKMFNK